MAKHVCPWWIGFYLASPLRRFSHKPEEIISPYVKEGITVLEIGPGMGFFTIPIAKIVGENGKVICIDAQKKMIDGLMRRVKRRGLEKRVVARVNNGNSFGIEDFANSIDFALLFAVVHEVPDQEKLFREAYTSLKDNSLVLISEPKGHVTQDDFNKTLEMAKKVGYEVIETPEIKSSHSAVLRKIGKIQF